jgi:F-type H+-transporting ATPase subunit a
MPPSRGPSFVPSRLQAAGEAWYEFVQDMVRQVMGEDGMKFFPLVFTIFSFVLAANMLGMFPYFFT